MYCMFYLVCVDMDGTGVKCCEDCNVNNILGCFGGAICILFN